MIVKGSSDIEIVQGDTLNLTISLLNVDKQNVQELWFSCQSLGVKDQFTYQDSCCKWVFFYENTSEWALGVTTYDITVVFIDGSVKTIQYKGSLRVLEKTNKI